MSGLGDLIVIGLSGPRGSGKTTAARMLEQEHGFTALAFADPLREVALKIFTAWDASYFEAPKKDEVCPIYKVSPRHVLREIGEHARALDQYLYVRAVEQRIWEAVKQGARRFVVTDIRFNCEAWAVRGLDNYLDRAALRNAMPPLEAYSVLVHVERSGVQWAGDHDSEVGPDRCDYDLRLQNAVGIDTLLAQVRLLMSAVGVSRRGTPADA